MILVFVSQSLDFRSPSVCDFAFSLSCFLCFRLRPVFILSVLAFSLISPVRFYLVLIVSSLPPLDPALALLSLIVLLSRTMLHLMCVLLCVVWACDLCGGHR